MTETAPDGSPVELYALLPELGEGELVARAVAAGATVLELGCGAGRITRQLVSLGYRVTAVDESPAMLAHVVGAETVRSRVEELDLRRRFDAALLASNLVNAAGRERRRAFLAACVRHAPRAVLQTLPVGWEPADGAEASIGDVLTRLHVDEFDRGVLRGRTEYELGHRRWTHPFAMRVFADESDLDAALGDVGLRVEQWLDRARGWLVATSEIV